MDIANYLEKNKALRNLHRGQRCFILGNGPSIKSQDLHFLRDELTIVTSSFHLHENTEIVRPAYWVMADPAIWNHPEKHFLPNLQRVEQLGIPTKLFLPSGGLPYFEGVHSSHLIDFHFFQYDHALDNTQRIDFTSGIPPYGQNVVIVSLMLAFFMGCNPIYLIGCDHDFYKLTQDEYEGGGEIDHAHPGQNVVPPVNVMPWSEWKAAMERMNFEYEQLHGYATLWGFDVFNATRGGCLENFPRVEYESLFPVMPQENAVVQTGQDPELLGRVALELINADLPQAALVLLEESLRSNINRPQTVAGLDYLKAICFAKMGNYGQALLFARQDYTCNPSNREQCAVLMRELEALGERTNLFRHIGSQNCRCRA